MGFTDDSRLEPDLVAGKKYVNDYLTLVDDGSFSEAISNREAATAVEKVLALALIPNDPTGDETVAGIKAVVQKLVVQEQKKNPTRAEAMLFGEQLSWGGRRKFHKK